MSQKQNEATTSISTKGFEEGNLVASADAEGFQLGKAPLKVVTGTQTTSNLNFELKPGAIVAHPRSTVVFVCG